MKPRRYHAQHRPSDFAGRSFRAAPSRRPCSPRDTPRLSHGLYPVRSGAHSQPYAARRRRPDAARIPSRLAAPRRLLQGKWHIAPIGVPSRSSISSKESLRSVHPERSNRSWPTLPERANRFLYVSSTDFTTRGRSATRAFWNPRRTNLCPQPRRYPLDARVVLRNYLAEINVLDKSAVKGSHLLLHKYGLDENTVFISPANRAIRSLFAKWDLLRRRFKRLLSSAGRGSSSPARRPTPCARIHCRRCDPLTIVDIAGGKSPKGSDGRSFLPVVSGKPRISNRRSIRHPDQPRHPSLTGILRHPCRCATTLRSLS